MRGRAPGGLRAEDRRHPPPGPERHGRSPPLHRPDEARVREPTVGKPGGLDAQLELRRPGVALGTPPHTRAGVQRRDGQVARDEAGGRAGADAQPPSGERAGEFRDGMRRRGRAAVAARRAAERELGTESQGVDWCRNHGKSGEPLTGPHTSRKRGDRARHIRRQRGGRVAHRGREHGRAEARAGGIPYGADAQTDGYLGLRRCRRGKCDHRHEQRTNRPLHGTKAMRRAERGIQSARNA